MTKEKPEKVPMPGCRLSQKKADEIIEKFGIEYSEVDKKAGKDSEYFIVVTKERGEKPKEEKEDVSHYIHKWEKLPDQELAQIPVEELIEALQKYYSKIDLGEKYPTREAVRRLRKAKEEEKKKKSN